MNISDFRFGFRCLDRQGDRKLTDARAAFVAHVKADPTAATPDECFLSHFQFADEFRERLEKTGSTKGYAGPTWAEWLAFDIDVEGDILEALTQAIRLALWLITRFKIEPDDLMIFYSGSKGFHILIRSSWWAGEPSILFHEYARRFCETLAINAGVKIDSAVYARVNLLRAPNSRHRKTNRFKIQLTFEELQTLKPEAIFEMAENPRRGGVPPETAAIPEAVECWADVSKIVDLEHEETAKRRSVKASASPQLPLGVSKLNPTTRAVLVDGFSVGDRHRELFSAAANFGEFDSVEELAFALLTPCGLNSGLSPSEVQRQIACGLKHGGRT